jgi:hypothetical protein
MFQRAPGVEVVGEVETDVYVVNADGSESDVELLFAGGSAGRWSPDSSEVSIFSATTEWPLMGVRRTAGRRRAGRPLRRVTAVVSCGRAHGAESVQTVSASIRLSASRASGMSWISVWMRSAERR